MNAKAVLMVLVACSAVIASHGAGGQSTCFPGWTDPRVSVEFSGGTPLHVLVHSHAVFGGGQIPQFPTIARSGNSFTVTYLIPGGGPAVVYVWDDTLDLGPLPPGRYDLTVNIRSGAPPDCLLSSTSFFGATDVPVLPPLGYPALAIFLGFIGHLLARGTGRQ